MLIKKNPIPSFNPVQNKKHLDYHLRYGSYSLPIHPNSNLTFLQIPPKLIKRGQKQHSYISKFLNSIRNEIQGDLLAKYCKTNSQRKWSRNHATLHAFFFSFLTKHSFSFSLAIFFSVSLLFLKIDMPQMKITLRCR